jgi:hypothetical protein
VFEVTLFTIHGDLIKEQQDLMFTFQNLKEEMKRIGLSRS